MDSKLRRMAILASMAVILLVSMLVLYTNRETQSGGSGSQTAVSGQAQTGQAGSAQAGDTQPEGGQSLPAGLGIAGNCLHPLNFRFVRIVQRILYAAVLCRIHFILCLD